MEAWKIGEKSMDDKIEKKADGEKEEANERPPLPEIDIISRKNEVFELREEDSSQKSD